MADRSYSSPPAAGDTAAGTAADAEAFAQLATLPAAALVAETAASLANLAAMRLGGGPDGPGAPDLDGARLLIDAFAGLLESSGSRLGAAEPQLRQALAQLRMAFVNASGGGQPSGSRPVPAAPQGSPAAPRRSAPQESPQGPPQGSPQARPSDDIARPRSGLWVPGEPL